MVPTPISSYHEGVMTIYDTDNLSHGYALLHTGTDTAMMETSPMLGDQDRPIQAARDGYQVRSGVPNTNTGWPHDSVNQQFQYGQQCNYPFASALQTPSFEEAYDHDPDWTASRQPTMSLTRDDYSDSPYELTQSPRTTDKDTAMEDRNS
jgi:hypothetical protein